MRRISLLWAHRGGLSFAKRRASKFTIFVRIKLMHSMKPLLALFCSVALVIAAAAPAALGQGAAVNDWTAVQSLTPGDEIVVTLKTEKETKGKFLDAGP